MKKFEEFIKNGIVNKQSPNKNRALALIKEAEEKKIFLDLSLSSIPKDKMNANFIIDYCYDILMEILRAKMFLEGYNAGNSHEAEVAYLKVLGFSEADVTFMDELRYYRNGTKYYGTILDKAYAEKSLIFMNKNYPKIKRLINIKTP
ncbi:MAG TPA: hypothetical protein VJB35_05490 [Candidatus Nanoarchaeia archaeon]|nr:hypothetical protein [Candidatus Nanoarchaeia archaeon]